MPSGQDNPSGRRVVVVGASDNPSRYSHQSLVRLNQLGFTVVPVHPRLAEIEGIRVIRDISDVSGSIDTVTVYVNPVIGATLAPALQRLAPRRVILNPGSECPSLAAELRGSGIDVDEACTLVLLSTGQF